MISPQKGLEPFEGQVTGGTLLGRCYITLSRIVEKPTWRHRARHLPRLRYPPLCLTRINDLLQYFDCTDHFYNPSFLMVEFDTSCTNIGHRPRGPPYTGTSGVYARPSHARVMPRCCLRWALHICT
ncbi:unnamed protein product [Nezara viridula]|uniref:Uncharacterized protein n=1 Tax=Nezara viridula TaxID=85310 RepID=A0A9P0HH77_NEZVI|nr:unnamed protein product [Nezara viridula]